jgi:hypothetical protein
MAAAAREKPVVQSLPDFYCDPVVILIDFSAD